jgi:hypothetical protein
MVPPYRDRRCEGLTKVNKTQLHKKLFSTKDTKFHEGIQRITSASILCGHFQGGAHDHWVFLRVPSCPSWIEGVIFTVDESGAVQ